MYKFLEWKKESFGSVLVKKDQSKNIESLGQIGINEEFWCKNELIR